MQRRPTVGPGSQWTPFRECLPGVISKLGKGTALQRGPNGGWTGRVVVVVVIVLVRVTWKEEEEMEEEEDTGYRH